MTDRVAVRSLKDTSLEILCRASNEAFADYPVDVSMTLPEMESLCRGNSVSLALSAGLFDGERLVGFWINGVRSIDGRTVAYDSGTAICKEYRGRGFSKQLGELSTRLLVEYGARQYVLEVLTQNEHAYKIYVKDGFKVTRKLLCLNASRPVFHDPVLPAGLSLEEGPFDPEIVARLPAMEYWPSWQNATESMVNIRADVHAVLVRRGERIVGYGLAIAERGRIAQIGIDESSWDGPLPSAIVDRLCRVSRKDEIGVINVDPGARRTLDLLAAHGFELHVDQYEMTRPIGV